MTLKVQELARSVLELAQRVDGETEVYAIGQTALRIEVSDGQVETMRLSDEKGVGIRFIQGGRLGFAYTTRLDRGSLQEAVELAASNARNSTPDEYNVLPNPGISSPMHLLDPIIDQTDVDSKVELARSVERVARQFDSRVAKVRQSTYSDAYYEVAICNSRGVDEAYAGSYCTTSILAIAEQNGQAETGWSYSFSRSFQGLQWEEVGREAAARAVQMLGAKPIETCKVPVVLDPFVAVEFLEVLAPALTAEAVQKGKSLFAGKLGQPVAGSVLRIKDSGLLPEGMATAPVDDEGVPSRETVVLENGILRTYLYNSYSAVRDGVESTGNGVRASFKATPGTQPRNFYVEPGTSSREELVQDIAAGMLVTEVMGMHTANPISGEFSVGASGLWIEKGKLVRPVRGVAIAGNLLDLLQNVEAVGNDLRFLGSVGSPSLRVKAITISGK